MEMNNLTSEERQVIRNALLYWESAWDWECPLLFGLSLDEFREAASTWSENSAQLSESEALAISSAFRELLYGASALPAEKVSVVCGISAVEVEALCNRLQPWFREVLG
ncbi:MAG TPA: hypothetical protein DCS87_03145 [Rheinheimera sp.]|nr:hypothetical protein [Rheinheimera sp.]